MRYLFIITLLITLTGCTTTPKEKPSIADTIIADLRHNIPIHAGMPVELVQKIIIEKNASSESKGQQNATKTFYHFSCLASKSSPPRNGALTYLVTGHHHFWIDMAIEEGRIKNIYITPGNFTYMLSPVLYDGTGAHKSVLHSKPPTPEPAAQPVA